MPLNPAATDHLPVFITATGNTDILMVVTAIFLLGFVLLIGLIFLRLHTMPERMAHKSQKLQFEIVAVLGLLSLFTHEHLYWVAGLLLAVIELPDFGTPLARIAASLERIADTDKGERATQATAEFDRPLADHAGESAAPGTETDRHPTEKGA